MRATNACGYEHHESSSSRGFGLCFCALAIGAHGGTITVDDNVPHGSRFRSVMPMTPPGETAPPT